MTTIVAAQASVQQVDISQVISTTLRTFRARAPDLLVLSLPFVFMPQILVGLLPPELARLNWIASLPELIFGGAATLLAYRELSGERRLAAWEAASAGLGRFGSLWGMGFISGLATIVGLILLVVPGLILMIGWAPATAVLMVEERTSYGSLGRAWRLTQGSRWRIAALVGLATLAVIGIALVVGVLDALLEGVLGAQGIAAAVRFVLAPLVAVAVAMLSSTGGAALYANLRAAKEGAAGDVAQVFD
jgi:hypothetical protein